MENCAKSLLKLTVDNADENTSELNVRDEPVIEKGDCPLTVDKRRGKALAKRVSKPKTSASAGSKSKGPSSVASAQSTSKNVDNDDLSAIKEQLSKLLDLVPVVNELKKAYDTYNDEMDEENEKSPYVTKSQEMQRDNENDKTPNVTVSHDLNNDLEKGEATYSVDYFKGVSGTIVSEGPIINEDIATGVANILQSGLEATKLEKLKENYLTPKNCERLNTVECNNEISKMVSSQIRLRDSHLKKVQNTLLKGLTAAVKAFDTLNAMTSLSDEGRGAVKVIADAIALTADSSHSLDITRRYLFKGELKEEFSALCTDSYPVKCFLFGDQLPEKIKDVCETQKISQRVTKTKRYEPYTIPQSGKRFPFLGQRSPFWKKGRGGGQYRNRYQHNQQQANYTYSQNYNSQQKRKKGTGKQ